MGAGLISGLGSFLSRTAERVDIDRERKRKEKEQEKKDRTELRYKLLQDPNIDPAAKESLALEQAKDLGLKLPDFQQTLSLDAMQQSVQPGGQLAAPPPSLMSGPEAQPIPTPQQAQAAQQSAVQPGAGAEPQIQQPAIEAMAPPPPVMQQAAPPQASPQQALPQGDGALGAPASAPQPNLISEPPALDPDIANQLQLDQDYGEMAQAMAPTPQEVSVTAQDPFAEAFAPEPGRLFTTPQRKVQQQLAVEEYKQGRQQAAQLEKAAAEFEMKRQQNRVTAQDTMDLFTQTHGREPDEREKNALLGLNTLLQKDPNIMEADAVPGEALLAAGIESIQMGDQQIPVAPGQSYKIRQSGEEISGLPTGEPPLRTATVRDGQRQVLIGIGKDGRIKELFRGAPIPLPPSYNQAGFDPLQAAINVKEGRLDVKDLPQAQRVQVANAAKANGLPWYSDKQRQQLSGLRQAHNKMMDAFDGFAQIHGFQNMAEMYAQNEDLATMSWEESLSRIPTNLMESGKGFRASMTGQPAAKAIAVVKPQLEILIPKGLGEVGNLAIQERQSALKAAVDVTDSIPDAVVKYQQWTSNLEAMAEALEREARGESTAEAMGVGGQGARKERQAAEAEPQLFRHKTTGKLYRKVADGWEEVTDAP